MGGRGPAVGGLLNYGLAPAAWCCYSFIPAATFERLKQDGVSKKLQK
jgi:hypothetical protein